jgi:hypothetical protein
MGNTDVQIKAWLKARNMTSSWQVRFRGAVDLLIIPLQCLEKQRQLG